MAERDWGKTAKNVGRGIDVLSIGLTATIPALGLYHMAAVQAALFSEVVWGIYEGGKATVKGQA